METGRIIQGRTVTADDIELIRTLIARHPGWHRTQLSQEVCRRWDWVAVNGQMKDMAARAVLRKLHAEGLITLPAAVRSANNAFRHRSPAPVALAQSAINGPLGELTPLQVIAVTDAPERRLFAGLLHRHHYLGYSGPVGENLKYLVYERQGQPLGCLLFGAPAWALACRDRFIGWDHAARARGLAMLANNMRFLILPWVRVPHLASHILGRIARRISRDWQVKYGHRLVLLETYVEQGRFAGTCYRAANWLCVGKTQGRSRNDRYKQLKVAVKSVWLYALTPQFRSRLCQTGE